ncbi:MAG TPA: heme iron utilization protein [Cyanobacteria bacterium UBA8803]|nr:heme iron utilization protein [Cyanobacteria bacterium UBA9273]HBL60966.1 heme iron utilization protein [Cyanobacteria bacterium UBA8803]
MSEQFSTEVSDRICKHMNDDHADAVALYAKTFGNSPDTEAAQMVSIDAQGMNLMAQLNGTSVPLRIEFDHVLKDAEDAHQTLIAMVKQARSR